VNFNVEERRKTMNDAMKAYGDMARRDIESEQAKVRRKQGESNESLAERLFEAQMEVYSGYAGSDLYTHDTFAKLSQEDRQGWIERARTHQ
jgi:hypothetical protein